MRLIRVERGNKVTISSLMVGYRNNGLPFSFVGCLREMLVWIFMYIFCSFNYRRKVIIKGVRNRIFFYFLFFKLGFTPCKAEQPQQGMELQEKEAQKDWSIHEISLEGTYSQ